MIAFVQAFATNHLVIPLTVAVAAMLAAAWCVLGARASRREAVCIVGGPWGGAVDSRGKGGASDALKGGEYAGLSKDLFDDFGKSCRLRQPSESHLSRMRTAVRLANERGAVIICTGWREPTALWLNEKLGFPKERIIQEYGKDHARVTPQNAANLRLTLDRLADEGSVSFDRVAVVTSPFHMARVKRCMEIIFQPVIDAAPKSNGAASRTTFSQLEFVESADPSYSGETREDYSSADEAAQGERRRLETRGSEKRASIVAEQTWAHVDVRFAEITSNGYAITWHKDNAPPGLRTPWYGPAAESGAPPTSHADETYFKSVGRHWADDFRAPERNLSPRITVAKRCVLVVLLALVVSYFYHFDFYSLWVSAAGEYHKGYPRPNWL